MPKGYMICKKCIRKLPIVKSPYCIKCGKEIISEDEAFCNDCNTAREFEAGRAICNYNDDLKRIILKIKYKNKREYIEGFAKLLAVRYKTFIERAAVDCIVPVPLHKSKLRERGFNQSEILAKSLSKYLNISVKTDYLYRVKRTRDQKGLTREERFHNLNSAFKAKKMPENIHNILLTDDVFTTGTTIEKCAEALKLAGAKKVYFLAICTGDF